VHSLQAEHARLAQRIVQRKRDIRQIRIALGMDAAALAEVERQLAAAGIVIHRVTPTPTDKQEAR